MAHFDGAVLHRIDDLQAGDDFARGENLDLEFAVGCLGYGLGQHLGAAIDVSSDFGKLDVMRHLMFGIDCAIAGAATAVDAARPTPAALRN